MSSSSEVRAILQGNPSPNHEVWIVKAPKIEGTGSGLKGMTVDLSGGGSATEGNGLRVLACKGKTKQIIVAKDPSSGECTFSPITVKGEILITESPSAVDDRPPIGDTSKVKVRQPKACLRRSHPLLGGGT